MREQCDAWFIMSGELSVAPEQDDDDNDNG